MTNLPSREELDAALNDFLLGLDAQMVSTGRGIRP